jgi:hypothetical protein
MQRPFTALALLLLCAAAPDGPAAESITEAIDRQAQSDKAAAAAQASIDQLSAETRRLLDDYRETLRRTEAAEAYNAHLRKLVDAQAAEHRSLERQMADIEVTRRDLVPLMLRMQDALERFVQLDRPFLAEERSRRLADLKALMARADVSDAEKFRRLIEAYGIENEYGKTVEAYRAELASGAGARTVDFLRVGRVGLFYQTLDGRETGAWNNRTRQWQVLPADYSKFIRKGIAMARKESRPELLTIAVEPPEAKP